MQAPEDSRYNTDVVELLIRQGLVMLPQYDMYLSNLMENGLNQVEIEPTYFMFIKKIEVFELSGKYYYVALSFL